MRRRQQGFTLLELLVTVAVIAILAAIAVPAFFGENRKVKGSSEVPSVFNDLRNRMEQYFQENGTYPATGSEASTWPVTPAATKQPLMPYPASWLALKVYISGTTDVYCGYTWVTGPANGGTPGPIAISLGFPSTPPVVEWYYLLAHCNLDGNSAKDSYYMTSSLDPTIARMNEGY